MAVHPTAGKEVKQITIHLHPLCHFVHWTSSMYQTFLFKSFFCLTMDCTILTNINFPKREKTAVLVYPEITQNFNFRQVEFDIA